MNSRIIRVLFLVIAVGIGAATAYFLKTIDADLTRAQGAEYALRERAGAVLTTLADVRAAQVAYVARGQGEAFWMARVTKLSPQLDQQLADLKAALASPAGQANLDQAAAALDDFHKLDARAQEYVTQSDPLLASDLIFSDGLEAMHTAAAQVQAALQDELRARGVSVAALRSRELLILGGGAGGVLLVLLIVGLSGASKRQEPVAEPAPTTAAEPVAPARARDGKAIRGGDPATLATVAKVCTEMARVVETSQLPALLERTARVLDASGIIVWVADATGGELHPAMAFGYTDQVMSRLGTIPREATNAAAAAYRAGELRTASGHDSGQGSLIAPLVSAAGCIGVLSAEMKGGSEKDQRSQALASIFAAQLATLISPPPGASMSLAAEA